MNNEYFGIALISFIFMLFPVGIIILTSLFYPKSELTIKNKQSDFKKGYTTGWSDCEKYLGNKYSKAFEKFEYDNTQLALENESLKKSYELWVKNRVGQLLKNENV